MGNHLTFVEDTSREDARAFFENAQAFYALLSSIFYLELTEEQINGLAESGFDYPDDDTDMAHACADMRRYLARRGANARQDLAVDYARVFLAAGVYEGDTAVPYESVYTSPEGIMMQDSRDDVVRIYAENGLVIPRDLNVPEDHLAFELEFMSRMSGRIAEAIQAETEVEADAETEVEADAETPSAEALARTQLAFIDEHLLNWVPDLLSRVETWAKLPFYPAITKMTLCYIRENRALLEELLEPAKIS
ncbi:molecular chaperone [Adlercreutzia sp. ZJ138]|uniref:TorD/DmsD family molecular chaperone n=1 Tax=Adlercreutzia sp. ZJ138 TaxID=2709405 RepID=UPI0013EDE231|nr:molecular chaperone TorD family protein [Adlercreutzia sp. ZJ138]